MKDASRHNQSGITASIDDVCDEFERYWQAGSPRPIGEFVDRVTGQEQARLVCELAMLDASYLQRQGGVPNWKALQVQFPGFKNAIREAYRKFSSAAKTAAWQPEQGLDTANPKHAAGAQAAAKVKLPRRFGHFEVRTILGRGAFGTVFRAYDTRLHRDVALKIPRGGVLIDSDHAERFIREARAASQLRHPSIVTVHDVGEVAGTVYIACEFIDGPTLQKLLADGYRPKARQIASFMRSLAVALHSAHSRGIIHRDLKPANILLDGEGKPHIADFGLARTLEQDSGLTIEGTVLGTPAYMSPEQALGRGHLADARSDLWSLGVIFYELLTLKRPFEGSTTEVLEAVRSLEPVAPRAINRDAPRDLETICLKCLVKDPEGRYPSAQHLAEDIDRWRGGKPIQARNVGTIERFVGWLRLNPGLATALLAVAATVLVGLIAVTGQWRRAEHNLVEAERQRELAKRNQGIAEQSQQETEVQRQIAERARKETEIQLNEVERQRNDAESARKLELAERQRADAALRDVHASNYTRNIVLAGHEWRANNVTEAVKLLNECPEEMRAWEWSYLKSQCESAWFSCRGDASRVFTSAVDVSGRLGAVCDQGSIHVWDLVSRKLRLTIPGGTAPYKHLRFSDDSKFLAAQDDNRAFVWRVKDGEPIALDWKGLGQVASCCFSPSFVQFQARDQERALRIWNLETGQVAVNRPNAKQGWIPFVKFALDGMRVHIEGAVYSAQNGELIAQPPTDDRVIYSPDLKRAVVIARKKNRLAVIEVDTWKELWSKSIRGSADGMFSPDGSCLALDVGATIVMVNTASGKQIGARPKPSDVLVQSSFYSSFAFAPDGQFCLLHRRGGVELLNPRTLEVNGLLPIPESPGTKYVLSSIRFSSDGTRAFSEADDHRAVLWDVPSGTRLLEFCGHEDNVSGILRRDNKLVTWSRDGCILVWDLADQLGERPSDEKISVNSFAFGTKPGELIAMISRGKDRSISMRNLLTGTTHDGNLPVAATLVAPALLSPDGTCCASYALGTAGVWDLASGELILSSPLDAIKAQRANKLLLDYVPIVAFSRDASHVAACWDLETVHVWDKAKRREVATYRDAHLRPYGVALTANGSAVAVGSTDGTITCMELATNKSIKMQSTTQLPVFPVTFSADGRWLACRTADRTIDVWDVASAKITTTLPGRTHGIITAAFSPDSQRLATLANDGTIKVWDTVAGSELLRLETTAREQEGFVPSELNGAIPIPQIGFSPDGRYLVSNSSGGIQVWHSPPDR